jgi:hypothetical protein
VSPIDKYVTQSKNLPLAEKYEPPDVKQSAWRDHAISGRLLSNKRFPTMQYLLPGLIPEGLTLLVSRPKLGKSWLLLQLAESTALGTVTLVSEPPIRGDVLHISLEDGERRLQSRMKIHLGNNSECWPDRMLIATKWRGLDQGGIEDIRDWCQSVPKPRLVTIDTLQRVRPAAKSSETNYASDYKANERLIQLCHEFPGLAIIVAHHDRKMGADDPFDTVSGTLGLTGGVDTIMLLQRHTKGITLHIRGRDLEDTIEKAMSFDRDTTRWVILGNAKDVHRLKEEQQVIDALRGGGTLNVKAIKEATGITRDKLDVLLGRMVAKGLIERTGRGVYGLMPDPTAETDDAT